MRRPIFLAALVLLAPTGTRACLNDRDTLAEEAQRLPDAVRVLTGRFPRNPPLYYQMRVARESAALKIHPDKLPLYDDVAVALDRLGRDDEALAVMARKLARMKALNTPGDASNSGDTPWYRYYANTGTFLAHRRLRHPDKHPLSDMEKGRSLIAESIRVNPRAHFGREKVQLAVMDWILESPSERGWLRLGDFLRHRVRAEAEEGAPLSTALREWREGLEGLIVLGGAWESPDAFAALSHLYGLAGAHELGNLAAYRGGEILAQGGRALVPDAPSRTFVAKPGGPRWGANMNFLRLRQEAEDWHARRTAYMLERLQAGRHPDTDPTFWADWHEPPAPRIVDKPWYAKRAFTDAATVVTALAALLVMWVIAPVLAIRHWLRHGFSLAEFLALGAFSCITLFITLSVLFPPFAKSH